MTYNDVDQQGAGGYMWADLVHPLRPQDQEK